jgi:5-methylcytosine-specific restriction enzyme subunit McrC
VISVSLSEWDDADPTIHSDLRGFRLVTAEGRKVAETLTRERVLEFVAREDGLALRSFSHVGRIELEGLTITVRPKLAPGAFLVLLRYAYSLCDLRLLDEASFESGEHGLQDLLIAQLQVEAHQLLHRGLVRRYVRHSEDLASPRGRLDIARVARQRDPFATRVACTHYPRSSDFLLNQVVSAGVALASRVAVAPALRRSTAHLAMQFADVSRQPQLTSALLRSAHRSVDRLSTHYRPALLLIDLLHQSSRVALEDGSDSLRLKGFLFDMNRFFQALVSKLLRESLPDWQVAGEVSLRHMVTFARGFNPRGQQAPRLRPDFVVSRGSEKYILDAKYRDLWRHRLPRDMLYQLAIYAMSQPAGATAAILYPTDDAGATDAILEIHQPLSDTVSARVALRPVVLPRLLELLQESDGRGREREALARRLVLGAVPASTQRPVRAAPG